jgi:DNA-directed RNA polymerase specialized sigma24 family protein
LEVTVHNGLAAGFAPAKDLLGEPVLEQRLYDAHAARLHAYCWSLVGDHAAEALQDTFATAGRLGAPRGDAVPWLYALARAACFRHGAREQAFGSRDDPDPLRRAASLLRIEHREVLVLSAGEWLDTRGIARLLGLAPGTVLDLIQAARSELERAVLDTLLHEPMTTRRDDVITAFEKGELPQLLAGRAPAQPPTVLRAQVLADANVAVPEPYPPAVEDPGTLADPEVRDVAEPGPLVLIGSVPDQATAETATIRRRAKRAVEAAGLAAAAAAAAGVFVAWPFSGGGSAGGGLTALIPGAAGTYRATSTETSTLGHHPAITTSVPLAYVPGMSPAPPAVVPQGTGLPLASGPTAGPPRPRPSVTSGRPSSTPTSPPSTPPPSSPSRPPSTPPTSTPTPPPPPPSETPSTPPTQDPAPTPTAPDTSAPAPSAPADPSASP